MRFFEILTFFVICLIFDKVTAQVTCPVYLPTDNPDYSDAAFVDRLEDQMFETLWDAEKPVLNKKGEKCKDVIFEMRESGIAQFEKFSLAASEFIWAYAPLLCTEPDLSAYKKVIDAYAIYQKDSTQCTQLLNAMRGTEASIAQALNLALDTAALNSGCSTDDPCKKKKKPKKNNTCEKGNKKNKNEYKVSKYDTSKFWDTTGWLYPCKLQQCASNLADSSSSINNLMSLMFAVWSIPPMAAIEDGLFNEFKYKLFNMSGTDPIPAECCTAFMADVASLRSEIPWRVERAVTIGQTSIDCPTPIP